MLRRQVLARLTLAALAGLARLARSALPTAKLIEWGWGTPSPTYVRTHIRTMERLPFDGLVFDLDANAGPPDSSGRFGWQVWGAKTLVAEDYSWSIEALQHTRFERFTENFLRLNVTPGSVDWYDEGFRAVLANAGLAARLAQQCRLKGILFDVEQYHGQPFHYPSRPLAKQQSFAAYQEQVRQRGREFMRAMHTEYPALTVLLTFGYSLAHTHGESLDTNPYGLLRAFLDGMLEAATPDTLIFDGWEAAYGYKKVHQFRQARDTMRRHDPEWTGVPQKIPQNYRASFGLWVDYGGRLHATDFSQNHFTPEAFEQTLRLALEHTDRYVWIYSQKVSWWDGTMPQPYIAALTRARTPR